jgi:hypothetical protein
LDRREDNSLNINITKKANSSKYKEKINNFIVIEAIDERKDYRYGYTIYN